MSFPKKLGIYATGGVLRRKRVHFPCPKCGCRLKELKEKGGKVDKCPACKASFVIPSLNKAESFKLSGVSELQRLLNKQKSLSENRTGEVVRADVVKDDDKFADFLIELDAEASKVVADTVKPDAVGYSANTTAVPSNNEAGGRGGQGTLTGSEKSKANDDLIEFMPLSEDEPRKSTAVQLTEGNLNVSTKLTNCEDCGRQVSKRASHCPNCGCPVAEAIPTSRQSLIPVDAKQTTVIGDGQGITSGALVFGGVLLLFMLVVAVQIFDTVPREQIAPEPYFGEDAQDAVVTHHQGIEASSELPVSQPTLSQSHKDPRTQLGALLNHFRTKDGIVAIVEAKYGFDINNAQQEHGAVKSINGTEVMLSWNGNKFGTPCKIYTMYNMSFQNYDFSPATSTAEVTFRDNKTYTSRYDGISYDDGRYERAHQIQGEMKLTLYFEGNRWTVEKVECKDDALESLSQQVRLLENVSLKETINDLCRQAMAN
jgi:predicted RNA-binding Zn-ribbon protein involved in translation (DUF1610 family)